MKTMIINTGRKYGKIDRNIYGHFAEHLGHGIYGGVFVGEESDIPNERGIRLDIVNALKAIKAPVIRWPGGSFSEKYHWRDAVGPKKERKPIINTSWGGVVEDNSFGTHEFFRLCELVGAQPYIAANVTTGTVQELCDWMDYITDGGDSEMAKLRRANGREEPWKLKYLGIGNENWTMRPEFYSDRFKLYASGIHPAAASGLARIACGPDGADYNWTETLMRMTDTRVMNGISLHYYTMPGYYKTDEYPEEVKQEARDFDRAYYYRSLRRAAFMEKLVEGHSAIMDRYDPEKKAALVVDEWGAWHKGEADVNPAFLYQQNTMRDAVIAGLTLNIFNNHNERVRMANLAQMVNVLQAVILTKDQELVLTPTYHVFDLYKDHMDAERVECYIQQDLAGTQEAQVPGLSVSASMKAASDAEEESADVLATIVNTDADEAKTVRVILDGGQFKEASIRYISGEMHAFNDFGGRNDVTAQSLPDRQIEDNELVLEVPACCVMALSLKR